MENLHAALVLHSSGKEITEKGIEAILKAAGVKPDDSKIKALVATLAEINIEEAIKGASLMSTAAPTTSTPTETKKDDKGAATEEKEEEGDDLGLSSLFG